MKDYKKLGCGRPHNEYRENCTDCEQWSELVALRLQFSDTEAGAPKDLWVNVYECGTAIEHRAFTSSVEAKRCAMLSTTIPAVHYRRVNLKREAIALVVRRGKKGAREYAHGACLTSWTTILSLAERWDPENHDPDELRNAVKATGARIVRLMKKR